MRTVIIGGVAGGMSAATRLRRLSETAEIIVLERSGHVSFANCGLPYYVGEVIEERSKLLLQTPASLGARFGLDVRVRHEVIDIDTETRTLEVRNLDADTVETLEYDNLILSPGATPVRPPLPGIELAKTLRNIEDTDAIYAAAADAKRAVVIGGGFIGIELMENLVERGVEVTLVEATNQIMPPMDCEMVAPVHKRIRERGVDLRLGSTVVEISAHGVALGDGTTIEADLVVAAIGVRPDSSLAVTAGIEIGERGGIKVDEHFRTSAPGVYAVGDAVEKVDANDDSVALVPLANQANLQGRRVADVIAGRGGFDRPVLGTAIVGAFGLQIASTGWSEKRAKAAGRDVRIIHTHPLNHAGYYPGATTMALKLIVDPETDAILGAQGVGEAGVDKRIDVIATAIAGGLTASELADLELAYAPQFGSAKDPVNMLGFIAENRRNGLTDSIQWHEVAAAVGAGATVLDVRTPAEHERNSIPGSVLIPLDDLRERITEVPEGELIVHCAVGLRGYLATRILAQHGIEARNLDGGLTTWLAGTAE